MNHDLYVIGFINNGDMVQNVGWSSHDTTPSKALDSSLAAILEGSFCIRGS
ncbi:hypothetical protein MTR_1g103700 [Medicago truncatula]|uniref:Uncharacterized protein n=1 Tax=Medicago truncatula TaxID=3880 RepID=A0A072VQF7_MEDTR|nr:hypothetical protein MTR_1g103700 [Medicago truncatula]